MFLSKIVKNTVNVSLTRRWKKFCIFREERWRSAFNEKNNNLCMWSDLTMKSASTNLRAWHHIRQGRFVSMVICHTLKTKKSSNLYNVTDAASDQYPGPEQTLHACQTSWTLFNSYVIFGLSASSNLVLQPQDLFVISPHTGTLKNRPQKAPPITVDPIDHSTDGT